jgi:hypothetical protein
VRRDTGPERTGRALAALCGLALTAGLLLAAGLISTGSASAAGQREWVVSGSLTGAYTNVVTWVNCTQPDGTVTCGPQRAFHCGGPIRRNGSAASMEFAPRGRELLGHFLQNASFTLRALIRARSAARSGVPGRSSGSPGRRSSATPLLRIR